MPFWPRQILPLNSLKSCFFHDSPKEPSEYIQKYLNKTAKYSDLPLELLPQEKVNAVCGTVNELG
jgi:hypothetical protein